MARLRRPTYFSAAVLAALVVVMLGAYVIGADLVSLALGAGLVAAALAIVVGVWIRPMRRELQRQRRHDERKARQRARRTRDAVHSAERRVFSQLEALAWLRDELDFKTPLPPTRGAAAAPDALLELVRIIDRSSARSVVELGSGVSTIVCGRRLQQAGAGRIVALEHDPHYAEATRAEIAAHGLQDFAEVIDAPLVDHVIDGTTWPFYQLVSGVPDAIDALFIDGPPKPIGPLARYPALPLLRDRMGSGAIALLDDGHRPDEREMVARWQAEITGLEAELLPYAKGAWLMTMP
jgi:predicted O-methyltransferase YrrM